ncbi:MAG: response regulator transcription factor [Thermodesulfobacteriota bacterium]
MAREPILLVEDDENIQQLVTYNLVKQGYRVLCADSGEEALAILGRERAALVLLDIMLPGMDGLAVCRGIRAAESTKALPMIILSAKGEEEDIVTGLNLGADDYLTKPFSPKMLLTRIAAVLRRSQQEGRKDAPKQDLLVVGRLTVDPSRHLVTHEGREIHLTVTEFAILELLVRRPGWVFTRQQIIDKVRGYEYAVTPRLVDVQIFGLRKKMGEAGKLIETVRGIGYRFKE